MLYRIFRRDASAWREVTATELPNYAANLFAHLTGADLDVSRVAFGLECGDATERTSPDGATFLVVSDGSPFTPNTAAIR